MGANFLVGGPYNKIGDAMDVGVADDVHLADTPAVVDAIVGGWTTSAIYYYPGTPDRFEAAKADALMEMQAMVEAQAAARQRRGSGAIPPFHAPPLKTRRAISLTETP